MIQICKYLDPKLIQRLAVVGRNEALCAMVDLLQAAGKLQDREQFYASILEREQIVSTGIGMGVAIPHAKLACYNDFFIAIGILQEGIDWQAVDATPVRLIFMIGGPDDKQTEYLQILSTLTTIIKKEEIRKKMLTLNSPAAIMALFG